MKIITDKVGYDRHNPFHRVHTHVINDKNLTPLAKLLYIIISNWSKKTQARGQYPSIKSLAKQLNTSTNFIDDAIANLKTYGYLTSTGCKQLTVWNVHPLPEFSLAQYKPPVKREKEKNIDPV
jgi:predicted HTH transcriptional regulator